MATTLTHGLDRPDDGDRGSTFWDDLAAAITRIDDHRHDGSDSYAIRPYDLDKQIVAVPDSGWSADGDVYKYTVTMTAGYTWEDTNLRFFMSGGVYDREEFFPKIVRVTDSTFDLYLPVNNQAVNVLHS